MSCSISEKPKTADQLKRQILIKSTNSPRSVYNPQQITNKSTKSFEISRMMKSDELERQVGPGTYNQINFIGQKLPESKMLSSIRYSIGNWFPVNKQFYSKEHLKAYKGLKSPGPKYLPNYRCSTATSPRYSISKSQRFTFFRTCQIPISYQKIMVENKTKENSMNRDEKLVAKISKSPNPTSYNISHIKAVTPKCPSLVPKLFGTTQTNRIKLQKLNNPGPGSYKNNTFHIKKSSAYSIGRDVRHYSWLCPPVYNQNPRYHMMDPLKCRFTSSNFKFGNSQRNTREKDVKANHQFFKITRFSHF